MGKITNLSDKTPGRDAEHVYSASRSAFADKTSSGSGKPEPGFTRNENQVSEKNVNLPSLMEILAALMKSGKKKIRKRRISLKRKPPEVEEGEPEEFEYSWPVCSWYVKHPPIPSFQPPDGVRCMYYWQIADQFPFMTLHRAPTTELKFIKADTDQSGLIEMCELRGLLKSTLGEDVSDVMIECTFNEIDTDKSGTLNFLEVLTVVGLSGTEGRVGLVRSCVVKTRTSELVKPITKLCLLECSI
ncbi:hypothetical protein DPMN_135844 [Dreissena polymorpha]|uniref:EF-hand domain-containing protein n=1 Tax=Dreissena polymorpha TaxID=45954 RepID=A0A9D4JC34_DREPO|nr:hypothetical protein DPMN_135844 [Dreissena polymorpha]